MRVLFVLPGLHRVSRGAEVAFESVAQALGELGRDEVVLLGAGAPRDDRAYRFVHVPTLARERFEHAPKLPLLRTEYAYEELSFAAALPFLLPRGETALTVTCSYPYTHWVLRSHLPGRRRPAHVFVTQNGDWPAFSREGEFRWFSCDGLVCTNPLYFERNRRRWPCALIPNGVEPARFHPGPPVRARLGLPEGPPLVLMVSALVEGKRACEGLRAAARLPEVHVLVVGDGPLREQVEHLGAELLPGRFRRRSVPHELMPDLYRSADALLHPCLFESFGNVYVEALASGLPVVAHDTPLTRWILGEHGVLVDASSSEALAEGLRRALGEGREGVERREAPAARAAFAAARYGWGTIARQYRDFFEAVVARTARREAS